MSSSNPYLEKHQHMTRVKKEESKKFKKPAKSPSENVIITGDDVLIEYVKRLINCLKNVKSISKQEKENFEAFISHYVWSNHDKPKKHYWERLQNRYSEMVSRRRKLLKSITKKELANEGITNSSQNP